MTEYTSQKLQKDYDPGLHDRLRVLIYTRLAFISIFLASTLFIVLRDNEALHGISVVFIFILIGATILISFIFVVLLFIFGKENLKRLRSLSYAQIFWDILFATGVLYMTGGIDSIFYILYYVNIVLASVLLFRKGGLLAAAISAICYGGVLALEVREVLPPFLEYGPDISTINETHVLAKIIVNWLFFGFLALVSGFVTEKLRKVEVLLEEKQIDIENLENFNTAIIESLKSGLLTIDNENRVLSGNASALQILGLRQNDIRGKKFSELFPEKGDEILEQYEDGEFTLSSLWRWETEIRRAGNKTTYLGMNIFPFRGSEVLEDGKVVIFEDLTAYKEMEMRVKRTEKLAAIGELAAGIAHEIRNPLASVSGAIEMLKQNDVPKEGNTRLMDIVIRETTRLDYLISDFLNFAKTPKLSKEVFSINGLIDETIELFQKNRSDADGTFIQKILSDNVYISADPLRIKQVIWNLLKNASQAIQTQGKITVETAIDKEKGEFVIAVKDEGEGILPEDLTRIFSPFFTTKKGGTGLGLATVHRIIEEHGGRVSVESKIGLGSEFRIFLPVN